MEQIQLLSWPGAGTSVTSIFSSQRVQWRDLLPAVSQVGSTSTVKSSSQSWPSAAWVSIFVCEVSRLQVYFTSPGVVQVAEMVSGSPQSWPSAAVSSVSL